MQVTRASGIQVTMSPLGRPALIVAIAAILVAIVSVTMLERQRAGLAVEQLTVDRTPVTLWRPASDGSPPLVVVAHGYGGSRQMMTPIALSLARSGFAVATFDFHGHGRHPDAMSGDVTSLEGTTAALVRQTDAVVGRLRDVVGGDGAVALLGHSMASDVVIRTAAARRDVAAVVAVSMYSEAVTPTAPEALLVVSGAFEGRLRKVAMDAVRLVDAAAEEGETAEAGTVRRRAVAAPWVEHVGVLYSATTLTELRDWIATALGRPTDAASEPPPRSGPWIAALLLACLALAWPLARLLGPAEVERRPADRTAWLVVAAPILPALGVVVVLPPGFLGSMAFGSLTAFLLVWGGVQLLCLRRTGLRLHHADPAGTALLLLWGLGIFALALDRYGAAFVPTGPRLGFMAMLLVGTLPFCFADAVLTRGRPWSLRLTARLAVLVTLLAAMIAVPPLGTAYTLLPVLVLYWTVYGVAGRWVGARRSPATVGLALGVILAWSIAGSTPMVAI